MESNINSLVSVIIPCYNDYKYIGEAIKSVKNQTYKNIEIIIIDDGSNLTTKKILQTIKGDNLTILFQDNGGPSSARNNGIRHAKGDYILNLDADDYIEHTFVEKAVSILNNDNAIVAVSCYHRAFKNSGTIEIIKPLGGKLKDYILMNNCSANTMFRKRCWEVVGGFDEKMQGGYEDWEFWIAVLRQGGAIHVIKEVLSNYRIKKVSRDQTALIKHDFELRKYIFLKHKDVFEAHMDFYIFQLLYQNSLLRNSIFKTKKSIDFTIGRTLLSPLRAVKKLVKKE